MIFDKAGCRQEGSSNRRRMKAVNAVVSNQSRIYQGQLMQTTIKIPRRFSVTAGMMKMLLLLGGHRHRKQSGTRKSAWLLQQERLSFAAKVNGSPL
jgi:hypothetical protein